MDIKNSSILRGKSLLMKIRTVMDNEKRKECGIIKKRSAEEGLMSAN